MVPPSDGTQIRVRITANFGKIRMPVQTSKFYAILSTGQMQRVTM